MWHQKVPNYSGTCLGHGSPICQELFLERRERRVKSPPYWPIRAKTRSTYHCKSVWNELTPCIPCLFFPMAVVFSANMQEMSGRTGIELKDGMNSQSEPLQLYAKVPTLMLSTMGGASVPGRKKIILVRIHASTHTPWKYDMFLRCVVWSKVN